jgi:RHS repeat-associated protein
MASLINGLGGTKGFGENVLAANDDSSTGLIDIRSVFESGLNFFGTTYNGFYINNNGNITFQSAQSEYVPFALTGNTSQPIIAPFFTDIDTRAGELTPSTGGNSTGSNLVYWDLDPVSNQVIVTWDDVGEYSNGRVPNAFQLILKDLGAGKFSIEFRYESIDWSHNNARAGYSAGNGINFFELPQSGTPTILDLESASNFNQAGSYLFEVLNGIPNQQPTNINLSATNIDENSANNTVIGNLTTTDPDVADTHTYSLVNNADGRFAIIGNQLTVANGSLLNFEANSSHSVVIRTTDNKGSIFDKAFTVNVNNINETPTDIIISSSAVLESQAIGTVVGNLTTTDPDTGNTFTYSLVTGAGSTDNSLFTITNNQLKTNAVFNYDTKNSYNTRLRTTDQNGLFYEESLAIQVTTPGSLSFASPNFTVNEDGTTTAAITVTRNRGSNGAVSATLNFKDGTAKSPSDYNNAPITVNFADGEVTKTVTIPIVNDTTIEPDENLQLILTTPTGGATIGQQNTATLTITDKNSPLITGLPQGSTGSNKGQTTIVIAGQNFSPTDQISLIAANGTAKAATNIYWVSETEAWATFDLQGLTIGQYDVKVQNGVTSSVINDTFTVTDGVVGNVNVQLTYPGRGVVTVKYNNAGQTDLTAPLFRINATNAQVTYPEGTTTSTVLQQLLNLNFGGGNSGPAGVLAPGERGEFSFAYTPNGNGLINFTVEQIKSTDLIDWASIKTQARAEYSFIDTEGWDSLWSNLTANLGQTYGQFQTVMAENANYLSQLGQPTDNLARLFAFEWKQAANTLTNVDLISATDVVDAAPGLSLTFNRTFHQSLAERYNLGSLGRGWSSQWDVRATTNTKGDVVIRTVGDLQRLFEKQTDGTFLANGATLSIANGEYRLKEVNGIVSQFGTDGKLSYVEDTNGNRIALQYTSNSLTKLVHTNGDSLTLAYNAQGRINQITDSTGKITSYSYDTSGEHLLSVTNPDGTTSYTYDTGTIAGKKHSLLSVTSDLDYQRSFEYDNQGRLVKEYSNGQTQSLSYSYDSTGGVTTTDSTGASQTILLDDSGNGGQIRGVDNQNLLFRYDANGHLIGATLPDGSQSGYNYDAKGNLTKQTNLLGQDVKFTYDSTFNQLTGFTDAKGNGVSYGYDTKGNLNKITYADGSFQQFSVDAGGNVTSTVNRRGNNIGYTYDTSGLLTKKQYADGSNTTYAYDPKGNLTGVTDASGTIAMQYDTANQLTKITYPTGRSLTYTYNAAGQRTKLVSGNTIVPADVYTTNYTYDTVGRLKTLTNATGQAIISYDYDTAGRLTKETNGNGTYTTYEYDQQSQIAKLINYKADNTVNSKFEYAYDSLGRRTSMTTVDGKFGYGYDAIGQLTSVVTPTNRTINYQYDAAGNRTTVADSGVTTNYSTNNLNEYTNVGNAVYTYDQDGNLTNKTQGGQTSAYTYNADNRLTKVVTAAGTWEYQYDGLGNRIATTKDGQRTEYLIDPTGLGDVVGEYNGSTLVANYNHGIGLVSRVGGTNTNYYDADALGSTVGLTATDGSYVNRYSYLPFGEDLTKVESVANPFEYVGQWGVTEEGNGLDFMRSRFYDSGLGRFTATDPININAGMNFYTYAKANPLTYIDPLGLWGIGGIGSASAEGGIVVGSGVTVSVGAGVFGGGSQGVNLGGFASAGAFSGAPGAAVSYPGAQPGGTTATLGGFAGVGGGGFITNATNVGDLAGPFNTYSLNLPFLSIQFGESNGIWIGSLTFGPAIGANISTYPTNTWTTSSGTNNDPHLKTLDGLGYDFQAVGEFTLVKSITDDFEIQTRQKPWGISTTASANAAIAIKSGGQRIALYSDQAQKLVINGVATTLADGALYAVGQNLITRQGNQYSIITANNDLILVKDRGTFLNINLGLDDNRKGKVVGLLGNNNDNRNDEFALRDGTAIGGTITQERLYGDYGNGWRITQPTSLFDYAAGTSTDTFTNLNFPRSVVTYESLTSQQRTDAELIARNAGITDPVVLRDAIVDIFITNGASEFIQGAIEQQRLNVVNSPNTLINPDGVGGEHYLSTSTVIPYAIRFSNNTPQGTTPVAKVTITQQLDTDLDFNTFSLNDFGFGDLTVTVPTGAQNLSQRLDLRSTKGVFVDVNAGLDQATGIVTWTLLAIDPATGNPTDSATKGFLPPNNTAGAGRGTVGYTIQPKANSANATRIDAQATITFNTQTPIETNPVFNLLIANQETLRNDFSGDGKSDIFWRNDYGSVALWQMNGSTITSRNLTSTSFLDSSWTVAGTGDFNGDGKYDVLWRNANGAVDIWTMNGATVISNSLTSTPTLDNSWKTAGTGDFNGDGKSDILWRNANGAVVVWAMDGSTVKSSTLTSTPILDASWKTAGTGDFNGDGKSDILWRNDDGSVALWQMNGANINASSLVSKLSSDWKINGTGDFNGDGKADILWRNDDGRVALWQMNGAAITSSSLTSTPSLDQSWQVAGIDDYNGDSKADILWRKDSGSLAVWQMDGSTVVSSTLTSVAADSNSWKVAAPIL